MSFSKFQRSRPALYRGQLPSGFPVLSRPRPQSCIIGFTYYKGTIHWNQSWERWYLIRQADPSWQLIGCQAHPRSERVSLIHFRTHLWLILTCHWNHIWSQHISPLGKGNGYALPIEGLLDWWGLPLYLSYFYKRSSHTASIWFARAASLTTVLWGKLIYVWKSMREAHFQTFIETQKVSSEKGVEQQRI